MLLTSSVLRRGLNHWRFLLMTFFLLVLIFLVQPDFGLVLKVLEPSESSESFLQRYKSVCENITQGIQPGSLQWCPCLPRDVSGSYDVSTFVANNLPVSTAVGLLSLQTPLLETRQAANISREEELPQLLSVLKGGHWRPRDCRARQSVAIIVPFRNRHEHLLMFENYMNRFLQHQQLDYSIVVIEQESPDIFNRAALMNVGYLEARRRRPGGYDCYIFHDVDLLPENSLNMYTCFMAPLHLGAYMNKYDYRMPYKEFFGGAIAIDGRTIEAMNGFPTRYYGWGGEDDDIRHRVKWQNLEVERYPPDIGRSFMVNHGPDTDNPINPHKDQYSKMDPTIFKKEGLSSQLYTIEKIHENTLHTKITISLEKVFHAECIIDGALPTTASNNYLDCMKKEFYREESIDCCREDSIVFCCNKLRYLSLQRRKWMFLAMLPVAAFVIYACVKWNNVWVSCFRYLRGYRKVEISNHLPH